MKRQVGDKLSTKIEWNAHMANIKSVLKILAGFNKATVTFKIGSQGAKVEYSVTNLIKSKNINAQYLVMSPKAQKELKILYVNGIDNAKLTIAYKVELDNFFANIKSHLHVLKDIRNTTFNGYNIGNLTSHLNKKGSTLIGTAKDEFIKLWANDVNAVELGKIYKKTLNSYLLGIKPALQVLKAYGTTEVKINGVSPSFPVSNLIKVFETANWETNISASQELARLYKHEPNYAKVKQELETAYKKPLGIFLKSIKPTLQVLKAMGKNQVTIAGELKSFPIGNLIAVLDAPNWETDVDACKELITFYKHNSDVLVVKQELETAYKKPLGIFLKSIKPTLQVFKVMGKNQVTIAGEDASFSIGNLIAVLDAPNWETDIIASKELARLYKHNSDASIIIDKLQTAYKLRFRLFLIGIKPALQVLKAYGTTEVKINGVSLLFPIGNLIKVFETVNWETNISASQELARLYKHNSNSSVVKRELETAYKLPLEPFLKSIQPILQVFKTMGSNQITISGLNGGVFQISNLTAVLDKKDWETDVDACKELIALHKHNSNPSVVRGELQVSYRLVLNNFLIDIKPTLQVFKAMGKISTTITGSSGGVFQIGNLIKVLETVNWETNILASQELGALYKLNSNSQIVINKLAVAYKLKLDDPFLVGIKPALQVFKVMEETNVTIDNQFYSIANLVNVLEISAWEKNLFASQELGALYKYNSSVSTIIEKLQTIYKATLGPFLRNIKPTLRVFKAMGSTEVAIAGEDASFSIGNLITILKKNVWETNIFASQELGVLYGFNSDHLVVKTKLIAAYKKTLKTFLKGIRSALQVFKIIGSTEVAIAGEDASFSIGNLISFLHRSDWEKSTLASRDLGVLYKHNSNTKALTRELAAVYKKSLNPFLLYITPILRVFEAMKSKEVTIVGEIFPFKIDNLTSFLHINNWETNTIVSKELGALYGIDSDHSVVKTKLIAAYKKTLKTFLKGIWPILQVFKTMGSNQITITGLNGGVFQIGNLVNVQKPNWETDAAASQELGALYGIDSDHLVVKTKLIVAYKKTLETFLNVIKPTLQVFQVMGSNEVKITGESKSFSIRNLITVLDKDNWETNTDASKELAALYKLNSNSQIVINKLAVAYKLKLDDPFLVGIKQVLNFFKFIGSTEITITGEPKPFLIGHLTTVLDKNDWEKNVAASQELVALYKHNPDHVKVKSELVLAYENLLDSFLAVIKSTLQEFTINKITEVWIDKKHYSIGNLILSANLEIDGSAQTRNAKAELIALYKYSVDVQKLQGKLNHFLVTEIDDKKILVFQKNWDGGKVSSYLLWLPVFDIKEVKLSQNKVVSVGTLADAIQIMLTAEKFDFTKLQGKARKQLLDLLNKQGKLKEAKTFQDDVWKQIKNHQKWKVIEGPAGKLSLQLIKLLLLKVQNLGINKVSHPFFSEGYDLSFLKDDKSWKEISFQELLKGMKVVVNETNVEFYSHLFPEKRVFQVPMKKLFTVFSEITITNIITVLEKVISDHFQQEKKLETKTELDSVLIIGLSVAGGILTFSVLGVFLYWFFKVKK